MDLHGMQKRICSLVALIGAAVYVAVILSLFYTADSRPFEENVPVTLNLSGSQDMLPAGRSMPSIKQSSESTEVPAIVSGILLVSAFSFFAITSGFFSRSDAHYKRRALMIQTARWCAS